MPELPEVEVLVRHLRPLLRTQTIRGIEVRRAKVLAPTPLKQFTRVLIGAKFQDLTRRGKYLVFRLRAPHSAKPVVLVGHLGMTGRIFLAGKESSLPKHAAVVFDLGPRKFVYEDTRYFGRLTLDTKALARLGPEPLEATFNSANFAHDLSRSAQPIKVKLLDQSLVAGIGNIYASEALFRAGISPRKAARRLKPDAVRRLWRAIRQVLREATAWGSTVPLNFDGGEERDGLFYFGRAADAPDFYTERLRVYDRAGLPCPVCGGAIRRIVQAARSTYFCPRCQR